MIYSLQFNRQGRMRYHPSFHDNHRKPWASIDDDFLINSYEALGPEECSLHLGRTIATIYDRVHSLRQKGLMPPAGGHKKFKRTLRKDIC